MKAPRFWSSLNMIALLLVPLSVIYSALVCLRFSWTRSRHAGKPVICAGNFTLGGTGKTPAVIYIAERLQAWGERPFVLSRGYGGKKHGPHLVDTARDSACDVGDEAMLLARAAPTIVGADRLASAKLAIAKGASALVLDDGMQNPRLRKDLTLALVDAQKGFGNRLVFPAGPLRGPLRWQMRLADAIIPVRTGSRTEPIELKHANIISADLQPQNAEWLKGARVLAFCGIGNPEKFRASLQQLGANIVHFESYPDHYVYDAMDAKRLIVRAAKDNLILVTTEKDYMRVQSLPETSAQLAGLTNSVAVKFAPDDPEKFDALLKRALSSAGGA